MLDALGIPFDREGYFIYIDAFSVFIDTKRYVGYVREVLDSGAYEQHERELVQKLVKPGDRVIEIGTAIGVVCMSAAAIVGVTNIVSFDANPEIIADAKANFRRNNLDGIDARCGVIRARAVVTSATHVPFYIDQEFWGSRLDASPDTPGIVKTVTVPYYCLEDEIADHAANVLIVDIEGGEIDLLQHADLTGVELMIVETHRWLVGEAPTDDLLRRITSKGFKLSVEDLNGRVVVFQRAERQSSSSSTLSGFAGTV